MSTIGGSAADDAALEAVTAARREAAEAARLLARACDDNVALPKLARAVDACRLATARLSEAVFAARHHLNHR